MLADLYDHVAAVLRSADAMPVPLESVRAELASRFGTPASERELRTRLDASDRFLVLDPEPPPWAADDAPEELKRGLRETLRIAGMEPRTHVLLVPSEQDPADPAPSRRVLTAATASLVSLWRLADPGSRERRELARALLRTGEIQRALNMHEAPPTTTPPPGPPAPGGSRRTRPLR